MMSPRNYLTTVALIGLAVSSVACCKSKADDDANKEPASTVKPEKRNTSATEPKKPGQANATATTANQAPTPQAAATDPNRPGRGLDGLPAVIPAPSSKPPTLAEWNAVPWEITVSNSTPLGCETKMVREWLRVSCRDKNKWDGEIQNVSIVNKGGVQAYILNRKGVASLVVQVVRNRRHVSMFTWTDRRARLVVDWKPGHPRPNIDLEYM